MNPVVRRQGQGNRFQAEVGPLASNHRSDWAKLQEAVIHEREKDKRLLRTRSCGLFTAFTGEPPETGIRRMNGSPANANGGPMLETPEHGSVRRSQAYGPGIAELLGS